MNEVSSKQSEIVTTAEMLRYAANLLRLKAARFEALAGEVDKMPEEHDKVLRALIGKVVMQ